jgi:hypothetical protein
MCTVTIIPRPGGFRLACNRDELRTRPPALPPTVARFGDRLAALPLDPAGGGTWVAANDAGIVLALLNVNDSSPAPAGRTSRGLVIPTLLGCDSLEDATSQALKLHPEILAPFRLVMVDARGCAAVRWDGHKRDLELWPLARPLLFTSSGLGDAMVAGPRRWLFDQMFGRWESPTVQEAFHRHHWPERPHVSVNMRREAARTVSYTVVEVGPGCVHLSHEDGAPGEGGDRTVVELELPSLVPA